MYNMSEMKVKIWSKKRKKRAAILRKITTPSVTLMITTEICLSLMTLKTQTQTKQSSTHDVPRGRMSWREIRIHWRNTCSWVLKRSSIFTTTTKYYKRLASRVRIHNGWHPHYRTDAVLDGFQLYLRHISWLWALSFNKPSLFKSTVINVWIETPRGFSFIKLYIVVTTVIRPHSYFANLLRAYNPISHTLNIFNKFQT